LAHAPIELRAIEFDSLRRLCDLIVANTQTTITMRSLDNMEHSSGTTGDVAERGLRYTKDQFEQVLEQTEEYVRENPVRAVGYALLAGFILNRLPICRILSGFVRLIMIAFKPAILAYGATKLYQAAQSDDEA
jgi:hypothetical protein